MEQINGFPSDFLSKSEKNTKEYALEFCKSAWAQGNGRTFYNGYFNKQRIIRNREEAAGISDVDVIKSRLGAMGNTAYANLNYDVKSPLPNYITNVIGSLINQDFRLDVESGVLNAHTEFDEEYRRRLNLIKILKDAKVIEEETGVDITSKINVKDIPATEDELELQMMDWRPAHCLALEDCLKYVDNRNDIEEIKKNVIKDLVENAMGATKKEYDENFDIVERWVDIENLITGWTQSSDYKKVWYAGELTWVRANELIAENHFSEDETKEIIKTFAGSNVHGINAVGADNNRGLNGNFFESNRWQKHQLAVLDLQWKTVTKVKKELFRTNKGGLLQKDAKPNGEKRKGHKEFVEKFEQTVYQAKWIIGSDKIYSYGVKPNQLLSEPNGFNKELDYTIYTVNPVHMNTVSMVEMLKTLSDDFKVCVLKVMGLVAKMSPPKHVYDISSINQTIAGLGQAAKKPKDIQDIAEATGVLYTSSRNQAGRAANNKPAYELPSSTGQISELLAVAQSKMQSMELVTGVPLSTIGSVDKDALVGIEKMKTANRTNSLRLINEAYKNILKKSAEKKMQMIVDSIEMFDKKLEDYGVAVGHYNVIALDLKERLLLRDHNIFVKPLPDAIELERIEQAVIAALQAQIIKPSDVLYIRKVAKLNPDRAQKYLALKEKKYDEAQAQKQQEAIRMQSEAQAQAAQVIEQAKRETEAMKAEIEKVKLQQKSANESKQSTQDYLEDSRLLNQKIMGELEKIRLATQLAAQTGDLEDGGGGGMKSTTLPKESGVRQPQTPLGVGN